MSSPCCLYVSAFPPPLNSEDTSTSLKAAEFLKKQLPYLAPTFLLLCFFHHSYIEVFKPRTDNLYNHEIS
jgi:hypothetical protein